MFVFIIYLVLSFGLFVGYKYDTKIINPITAFNAIWFISITLLLILIGLGYYEPTSQSYYIILLGLISYNLATLGLVFCPKRIIKNQYDDSRYSFNKLNLKLVYIISVLLLIYSIFAYSGLIRQYISNPLTASSIRNEYFESHTSFLEVCIFSPIRLALMACVIVEISRNIYNKVLIGLTFFNSLIFLLASGSRFTLLGAMIMFVGGWILFENRSIKNKKHIYVLAITSVLAVIMITVTRNSALLGKDIFLVFQFCLESISRYYAGGIIYLGNFINVYEVSPDIPCSCIVEGILFAPLVLLRWVGFPLDIVTNLKIGQMAQRAFLINDDCSFNAFVTMFGTFFMDGGYFAVIIESLLVAWIFITFYNSFIRHNNFLQFMPRECAIYLIFFLGICCVTFRWIFYLPENALSFFYLFLFYKKNDIYKC